jgi:hypothetical protein
MIYAAHAIDEGSLCLGGLLAALARFRAVERAALLRSIQFELVVGVAVVLARWLEHLPSDVLE